MTMDQRQLTLVAKVQIALNRQIFVIRMTINGQLYQTLFYTNFRAETSINHMAQRVTPEKV